MKNDVVKAARNLETDLMYGNPLKAEFVERRDIETLIAYVNKKVKKAKKKAEKRTSELTRGDTVKVLIDVPGAYASSGDIGKLAETRDHPAGFVWGVRFPSRAAVVYFKREELEKVNQ
jgi:hypothetical protein